MLHHFEKQNEEGRESRRGVLAMKYFLRWRGVSSVQTFIDLRERLEVEAVALCEAENRSAERNCFDTKEFIQELL